MEVMDTSGIKDILRDVFSKPGDRAIYYRFTHVMIELLEKYSIRYFAHSGTMLGCVRHKGFIPWDDDIDLMIPLEDEPRLVEMSKELAEHGVLLRRGRPEDPADGLWQFRSFGRPIMGGSRKYFGFDIFIGEEVELENGERVYHYQSPDFRRWYRKRYVKVDDVFPRKRYPFGPLFIWGMRDPTAYFQRSQFDMEAATLHVHNAKRAAADLAIERLTAADCYPIRDPEILSMTSAYEPTDFWDLDHYRVPDSEVPTHD